MGSVTFQIVGDGTVGTLTKTYTVSNADVNRHVAAWKTRVATSAVPNPTTPISMLAWADFMMATSVTIIQDTERATAANAITPIGAT